MNAILEKLGLYDLIAVLLTGISISTFSVLVLQLVYGISLGQKLQVSETLIFMVISYFLGLVFQELGSLIQNKTINKNNGLLKRALKTAADSHNLLTCEEKTEIFTYVKRELHLKEYNENIIYNYCKFYVIRNCNTTRIDKDQSLSAMSRSLSLYFSLLSLAALITLCSYQCVERWVLFIVSLALSALLYQRCVRFAILRYIYILRAFYYNKQLKNSTCAECV